MCSCRDSFGTYRRKYTDAPYVRWPGTSYRRGSDTRSSCGCVLTCCIPCNTLGSPCILSHVRHCHRNRRPCFDVPRPGLVRTSHNHWQDPRRAQACDASIARRAVRACDPRCMCQCQKGACAEGPGAHGGADGTSRRARPFKLVKRCFKYEAAPLLSTGEFTVALAGQELSRAPDADTYTEMAPVISLKSECQL